MRCTQQIGRTGLAIAVLLSLPLLPLSQVPQKDLFMLHISKIKHVENGCAVDAGSTAVRFKISSDVPAACSMLRASETYKAFRATIQNDPNDRSKDAAVLVIYNNLKYNSRDNAFFDIDSEEAIPKK